MCKVKFCTTEFVRSIWQIKGKQTYLDLQAPTGPCRMGPVEGQPLTVEALLHFPSSMESWERSQPYHSTPPKPSDTHHSMWLALRLCLSTLATLLDGFQSPCSTPTPPPAAPKPKSQRHKWLPPGWKYFRSILPFCAWRREASGLADPLVPSF